MKLIIEVEVKALAPSPHEGCAEDRYTATMRIDANDEYGGPIRIKDCIEKSSRHHRALMEIAESVDEAIKRTEVFRSRQEAIPSAIDMKLQ